MCHDSSGRSEECDRPIHRREHSFIKPQVHQPGIEPGSVPWQGTILPLDHWCILLLVNFSFNTTH